MTPAKPHHELATEARAIRANLATLAGREHDAASANAEHHARERLAAVVREAAARGWEV